MQFLHEMVLLYKINAYSILRGGNVHVYMVIQLYGPPTGMSIPSQILFTSLLICICHLTQLQTIKMQFSLCANLIVYIVAMQGGILHLFTTHSLLQCYACKLGNSIHLAYCTTNLNLY